MSLASPAPKVENFAKRFSELLETLDPLLAQPLSHLSKRLQAGSSAPTDQATSAAVAPKDASTSSAAQGSPDVAAPAEAQTSELSVKLSADQMEREGKLDSARLHASAAYVLLDLVWMYLKIKGIDTSNHPVLPEMERVKAYFHKIKNAKNPQNRDPRSNLDTAAANRFIKHGLGAANVAAQLAQPSHKRFDFEKDEDEKEGSKKSKGKKKSKKDKSQDAEQSSSKASKRKSDAEAPHDDYDDDDADAAQPSSHAPQDPPATKRPRIDPFVASEGSGETMEAPSGDDQSASVPVDIIAAEESSQTSTPATTKSKKKSRGKKKKSASSSTP